MRPRRLFWRLFPAYLAVTLAVVVTVALYASHALHEFYVAQTITYLSARAKLARSIILEPLAAGELDQVDSFCKAVGDVTASRITVVLPDGTVAGDTEGDAATMENHLDRPEIAEALSSRYGEDIRFSNTVQRDMLYVAVPVDAGGAIIGVVRVALPLTFIEDALASLNWNLFTAGLGVALMAAAVSLLISRRMSRPLEQMTALAGEFARGHLQQRLTLTETAEVAALASAMNTMAAELDDRIHAVVRQHNELEAVLASMVEGVLAVSTDGRILSMNRAAGELLRLGPDTAIGRPLHEVIRNPELQEFVSRVLATRQPLEGEVVLYEHAEHYLQLHGTSLCDAKDLSIGAVVVINDVTHLRRLERVRRDFVANVSHEIRTPVTSIKGYVETLLDGAMDDADHLKRFLTIILRQADRLNDIIEDLLTLARIEQDAREAIPLERARLRPILEAAVLVCTANAAARDMDIDLQCESTAEAKLNPALFEQAVVNLLDNAIKYSEAGDTIQVTADRANGETVVRVIDHGRGIDREHLPRLFERFYRVDKGRSRKLGGTGLGLAIVKHIMHAHAGRVDVQSAPGKGSTFSLFLPPA